MTHALLKRTSFPGLLAAVLLGCSAAVLAHEGHHHGDEAPEPAPLAAAAAPHIAPEAAQLEVVAQREGAELAFYVDDYASNAPLDGLQLSLRSGAITVQAAGEQGRYSVPAELLAEAGRQAELSVRGDGIDARLQMELPPPPPAAPARAATPLLVPRLSSAGLILALLAAAWLLRRRRLSHAAPGAGAA